MLEFRAEGLCRNANHLSREELSRCMASGEVLQSTALAYDTGHRLRFELGGLRGIMPFADCVDAAPGETVKILYQQSHLGLRAEISGLPRKVSCHLPDVQRRQAEYMGRNIRPPYPIDW